MVKRRQDSFKDLFVIGSGGQGRETAQLVKDINRAKKEWNLRGYLDERKELLGKVFLGIPVIGGIEALSGFLNSETHVVCAIGNPQLRKRAAETVKARFPEIPFASLIHPTAVVAEDLDLGEGSVVCAHTVMTTGVRLGRHVLVDYGATVGHDAVIGAYGTLLPGCRVSGRTRIGEEAMLGAGAIVIQELSVGRGTIVGAGSVVVKSLPENCIAYGVPARVVKAR